MFIMNRNLLITNRNESFSCIFVMSGGGECSEWSRLWWHRRMS